MHWFEDWFDSKYYHILYKNRDQQEAENFLTNLNHLEYFKNRSNIIDVGCGKGRHALLLSRIGHNVTGIDLSESSISSAKRHESKNLKFEIADMRKYIRINSFDIALSLFTSFGYFEDKEDDRKVIKVLNKNLKKNGILIIDFLNSKKVISNLVNSEIRIIDEIKFEIKRQFDRGFIKKNINIYDNKKHYFFQERVRALTKKDFKKMLDIVGMKIIDIFGDYNLNEFDESNSDRLIIIAKK